jgi:hypothetical protein
LIEITRWPHQDFLPVGVKPKFQHLIFSVGNFRSLWHVTAAVAFSSGVARQDIDSRQKGDYIYEYQTRWL